MEPSQCRFRETASGGAGALAAAIGARFPADQLLRESGTPRTPFSGRLMFPEKFVLTVPELDQFALWAKQGAKSRRLAEPKDWDAGQSSVLAEIPRK